MACGFGACFGCVVRTTSGYRRICVDGPVVPGADLEAQWFGALTTPDPSVELGGLELAHPILNGSGTFDAIAALRAFGEELREQFPFSAFVSKTITLAPREGNPPPRLWETPAGMINSIGLPNKGLEGFLADDLPALARLPVPLVVSVAGFSPEEFATLVETVGERPEVAAIELNVSCPNVKSGCVMGAEPRETWNLMERLRPLTSKALIVKLTPNVTDVVPSLGQPRRPGPTPSRSSIRSEVSRSTQVEPPVARRGTGRPLGPGDSRRRARDGVLGRIEHAAADRRHGRCPIGPRRARLPRRGSTVCRRRDGELSRPRGGPACVRRAQRATCECRLRERGRRGRRRSRARGGHFKSA